MKYALFFIILASGLHCFAQCPSPVTLENKGGICLGSDTLVVSSGNSSISKIVWYNGTVIDTVVTATAAAPGVTVAGGNGSGANKNQLQYPSGVYLDAAGNIYVADEANQRIQKFPSNSTIATNGITVAGGNLAGNAANQLYNPIGVYVDAGGNIYVADEENSRVQKFPPYSARATNGVTVAGGNGAGAAANQLHYPQAVFVDGNGNVFVADNGNNRVQEFTTGSANGITVAGGNGYGPAANQLYAPASLFVDGMGNIYVADAGNNRIQKFPKCSTGATNGVTVAGGNGLGLAPNQLNNPQALFVDASGYIYVSDQINGRVQRFPPNSTSATNGVTVAGGNGLGSAANQLDSPFGLFVDAAGYVYVADNGNNRVLKFPPLPPAIDSIFIPSLPGTYTAVVTNSAGCTDTTNAITIYPNVTPAINISTAPNTIAACTAHALDTVHFTATALNGGTAPAYQWKVNGANAGTNSATFTAALANNSIVACTLTSNAVCATTPIVTSVTDTVKFGTGNATIKAVGGICLGSDSLVINGGGGISKIVWYNGSTVDTTITATTVTPPTTYGITVAGGNGRGNTANQFNLPNCVFVDVNNNIYVSDETNDRVQKFLPGSNSSTNGQTVAGSNGIGAALNQLQPNSVCVDGSGYLYVADNANARILKFPPGSTSLSNGVVVAGGNGQGKNANQFINPVSVFVDGGGSIYVIDAANYRLQKFPPGSTSATNAITLVGNNGYGPGANQFNGPASVFVDGSGNIFVADAANNRIQKFARGSSNGTTVAGGNGFGNAPNQLSTPSSVWVDAVGNIYVADVNNERIQKFPPGSRSATNGITVAGGNGVGSAANQFSGPNSVSVDANGNIYVSDAGNNRIQEFLQVPITITSIDTVYTPSAPGTYTAIVTYQSGCTVTTNAINISPKIIPSVTLTATANAVTSCVGLDTIHITATATNGGTAPGYQWQVNGVVAGIDSAVFTAALANNAIVTCKLTSNAACAAPVAVTSSGYTVQFSPGEKGTLKSKGGICLGSDTLIVSGEGNISKIVWYNGAAIDTTITGTVITDTVSGGVTVAGGNGQGSASNQLNTPNSIAVDANGNLYVADLYNYRIQKFSPGSATGQTVAGGNGQGSNANQFQPNSVFVDGGGNLFIADNQNDRIQMFPPGSTNGLTVAGGNGFGAGLTQFNDPVSVCTDANGNIYVADASNQRVQKFPQGSTKLTPGVTVAGGNGQGSNANQFSGPSSVFVDGSGNIYVTDGSNHRVQKFTPGSLNGITVAGGNGNGSNPNQLSAPSSVFVDASGFLYVTDPANERIQKFPPGSTSLTNGITVAGGNGLGNGPNQFNYPFSVYVDASGAIYVADLNNNRVQKFNQHITHQSLSDTTLVPAAPGTYTAVITDSSGCAVTTNAIVVNPMVTPAVSISTAATIKGGCSANGLDTVRFVATAVNGGSAPVYKWAVNGAAMGTDSIFTAALTNNAYVTCTLTSNAVCTTTATATSNIDTVTFGAPAPPLLTTNGSICLGTSTLAVSDSSSLSSITWYNGTTVDTVYNVSQDTSRNGITVAGGNGMGSQPNQFASPFTISFDGGGNMYIADGGNNRVEKFPPGSTSATNGTVAAGGNGLGTSGNQFNNLSAAYVDVSGAIYATDGANARVLRFPPGSVGSTNGTVVAGGRGTGSEAYQLSVPGNVGFDNAGNMYVFDRGNQRVQQFAPGSTKGSLAITVAGGNGPGANDNQFNILVFGYVDSIGTIYVADLKNYRVQKFPPGSTSFTNGITVAGGNGPGSAPNQLAAPYSVYVDGSGNIYVADAGNNRIEKFPPNSNKSTPGVTVAGGNGAGSAANQLNYPEYVYVDGNGYIYVTDAGNQRIQKFLPSAGAIGTVFTPVTPGTYTAVVTTSAGCVDTTNAIVINPVLKPAVLVSADTTTVCAGSPITLIALAIKGGTAPVYQWQINGLPAGKNSPGYTTAALADGDSVNCVVTGGPGCFLPAASNSIKVTILPLPTAGPANDLAISPGQNVTLNMSVTGDIKSYLWSPRESLNDPNIAKPVASPDKTTVYTLTVTATDGCTAIGTITVKLAYPISIPNAFTPNGDNSNDVFYVLGGYTGDKIKDFIVFNRGGQKIFEEHNVMPNDRSFGWDGNFNGLQQPPGTYVYVIKVLSANGTEKMFKGTVVLVR